MIEGFIFSYCTLSMIKMTGSRPTPSWFLTPCHTRQNCLIKCITELSHLLEINLTVRKYRPTISVSKMTAILPSLVSVPMSYLSPCTVRCYATGTTALYRNWWNSLQRFKSQATAFSDILAYNMAFAQGKGHATFCSRLDI